MIDVLISEYNNAMTQRILSECAGWKQVAKDRFMDGKTGIVFKWIGQSSNRENIKRLCNEWNKELGVQVNGK